MSTSASGVLTSIAVGLDNIVDVARREGKVSGYYFNGFQRLGLEVRFFLVVAAVLGVLINELVLDIMADDRLLLHVERFRATLGQATQYIEHLPDVVWTRLAIMATGHEHFYEFRSTVLDALRVALAYIHERIGRQLDEYPLSLIHGSVQVNLKGLGEATEKPHDVFAAKLWALIRIGYDTKRLAEFLTLLQNLPFSTLTVEQAHGSSAVIHRYHPSLGLDRHLQRSFLHQVRFVFLPDDTSKHENLLVSKLHKLMAKRITGNTARTQFFKEAVQEARRKVGPNASISHESMQKLMAMHVSAFKRCSPQEVQQLQKRAKLQQEHKMDEHAEAVADIQSQINLHNVRTKEDKQKYGLSNHGGVCRFTEQDIQRLTVLLQDSQYTRARLQQLRADAITPASEPCLEARTLLEQYGESVEKKSRLEPFQWVKYICQNRDFLMGVIVFAWPLQHGSVAFRT
eukprot:5419067-Amphidinium_carterae.1